MIQFAGIAVLVLVLMVGLIITVASIIGYFICCKRGTQYKLGNKITLRTSFIIGISITSFPVMFFYMITSNNRKQDEQALIREQQAIEEANIYDEKNNINIMRLINISPKKYNSILSCYLYEKRCLQ